MVARLKDGKEISIDYREMAPGKAIGICILIQPAKQEQIKARMVI